MDQTRRARIQSVILEEVSHLLSREIKDPRIPPVVITRVELTPDAGLANIFFMPQSTRFADMNAAEWTKDEQENCLEGMMSAKGFVRKHLAKVLTIRSVPELAFEYDAGLQNSVRVHELLKEIDGSKTSSDPSDAK